MKTSYKIEHLTKTDTFNLLKSKPITVATISLGHIPSSRKTSCETTPMLAL